MGRDVVACEQALGSTSRNSIGRVLAPVYIEPTGSTYPARACSQAREVGKVRIVQFTTQMNEALHSKKKQLLF